MSAVVLATKRCRDCGETKPLVEFYRHKKNADGRHSYCRPCNIRRAVESKERRRAQMGDVEFREYEAALVRRSRERTGNVNGKAYERARNRALKLLVDRHSREFEQLLAVERRREEDRTEKS